MSNSVQPHRRQPTRLPHPWDSPGKNTGVGCHFLLQCMKVKSESEVTQLCPTPSDPMDCSLPAVSVHGTFQARVLECIVIAITNSWSLLKITSMSVIPSNRLILCHPLLLPPSIFPSIRVFLMSWLFASGGQRIGASASASVLPMSNSGLISCRIDWFDLLAVLGTLKSFLQHNSTKASILQTSLWSNSHIHT